MKQLNLYIELLLFCWEFKMLYSPYFSTVKLYLQDSTLKYSLPPCCAVCRGFANMAAIDLFGGALPAYAERFDRPSHVRTATPRPDFFLPDPGPFLAVEVTTSGRSWWKFVACCGGGGVVGGVFSGDNGGSGGVTERELISL